MSFVKVCYNLGWVNRNTKSFGRAGTSGISMKATKFTMKFSSGFGISYILAYTLVLIGATSSGQLCKQKSCYMDTGSVNSFAHSV